MCGRSYGAALVAAFLPYPVFAVRAVQAQVAATSVALGSLTQLLLNDLKNAASQTPHFVEGTWRRSPRPPCVDALTSRALPVAR